MVMPRINYKSLAIALPGADQPVAQNQFRISPSGMEFVSDKAFDPFQVLELDLDIPSPEHFCSHFSCSGVVVECEPVAVSGRFRITLLFLDLPDCARKRIESGL